MNAYLIRQYRTDCTLGTFVGLDDKLNIVMTCVTLELPFLDNRPQVSCIPEGIYDVVTRESEKFGLHYHITDVPGREWILFHPGNFTSELRGCILPGMRFVDLNSDNTPDIAHTRSTLNKMLAVMGEHFVLNVFSAPVKGGALPGVEIMGELPPADNPP